MYPATNTEIEFVDVKKTSAFDGTERPFEEKKYPGVQSVPTCKHIVGVTTTPLHPVLNCTPDIT